MLQTKGLDGTGKFTPLKSKNASRMLALREQDPILPEAKCTPENYMCQVKNLEMKKIIGAF